MKYTELKERFPEITHVKCGLDICPPSHFYSSAEVEIAYAKQPNGDLKKVWPEPEEWRELPEAHCWLVRGAYAASREHIFHLWSKQRINRYEENGTTKFSLLCSTIPTLEELAELLRAGGNGSKDE